MLTIVTALYCEAESLIKFYHLKKDNQINKFQVFVNEELRLLLTNSGSIAAAAGVTYLSTLFPPESSDFLINIGICAASDQGIPRGSIFLCNQIMEESTGRSFYPDVIYRNPFPESNIITCSTIRDHTVFNNVNKNKDFIIAIQNVHKSNVEAVSPINVLDSNSLNYFIIEKKTDLVYGPLSKVEYFKKRDELRIPKKLVIKDN
jgi:hypothetical protein